MIEYVEAMVLSAGWASVGSQTLRRQLDGFENFNIAGATAQISRQRLLDLLALRRRVGTQQGQRRQQHARRAIATLRRPELAKGVLQLVQRTPRGHALNGDDLLSLHGDGQ